MEHDCYELRCSDVGFANCPYVAKSRSMDELMNEAGKHSAEVHNITEYSDSEMKDIKAAIRHDQEC
jgi:predicted small metal-binding protein